MAKKKNNNTNNNGNVKKDGENDNNSDKENKSQNMNDGEKTKNKKEGGDGQKKKDDTGSITMVFKVDMHCEGCATKIVKCVRCFEGVESVKTETELNKLTVVGTVDPTKIRDRLLQKTKKKVDLISPQPPPKKDKENNPKQDNNKSNQKNTDDKKPKEKEPPVTTAVLKLGLHCQGCVEKIHKIVSKTKGVKEMSVDKQKDTVTVKGTMDVKALTENLKERMKRPVEIVPPKKEKDDKDSSNGNGTGGGGDNNGNGGSGGKKKKKGAAGGGDGGGEGAQEAETDGGKMEGNKMEYMIMQPGQGYGFGYPPPGFEYGYSVVPLHAPQIFSDENPNACSIM